MAQMLNNDNFNSSVETGVCVVDFFATWCGPCKMLGQELEDLSSDRTDFKIVKVDVDLNPNLARMYGIMSVPTLMYFNNGKLVKKESGFVPKEIIVNNFRSM